MKQEPGMETGNTDLARAARRDRCVAEDGAGPQKPGKCGDRGPSSVLDGYGGKERKKNKYFQLYFSHLLSVCCLVVILSYFRGVQMYLSPKYVSELPGSRGKLQPLL